jgi:hypothetical protein
VTSTLRAAAAATASAALLLTLAACSSPAPEPTPSSTETKSVVVLDRACADDSGVTVAIDASALEDGDSKAWCIGTDEELAAADALTLVNVTTEGTDEYGDQVVCRVNGVPAEDVAIPAEDGSDYFETCQSMPAAFAYWSIWTKPAGGEWGYAQEGLSTLQLAPGDALELLFTLNGEPAAPAS